MARPGRGGGQQRAGAALLARERDVQPVDAQRKTDRGQLAPEPAEQVVVATAAADRRAERGVVDLEDRAGVVADVAHEAEIEDHPLGHAGFEQLVHQPQARHGLDRLLGGVGRAHPARRDAGARRAAARQPRPTVRPPAAPRSRPTKSRRTSASSRSGAGSLGHLQAGHQGGEQRGVAEADAVVLQPGRIERVAQHGERLGGALGRGRADQLDPRLQQLARLSALGTHAAVAVREVAEAQRRLAGRVAGGDDARDRHGHVRAQHEHGSRLVEHAIRGLRFGHVGAREHRLVLERRRVDLAIAVALEHAPQRVRDRTHLARLFG